MPSMRTSMGSPHNDGKRTRNLSKVQVTLLEQTEKERPEGGRKEAMKRIQSPAEYKIKPVGKVEKFLTKTQFIYQTPVKRCNEKGEIVVLELRDLLIHKERIAPVVWLNGVATLGKMWIWGRNSNTRRSERARQSRGRRVRRRILASPCVPENSGESVTNCS
jgi:hypothetical protein